MTNLYPTTFAETEDQRIVQMVTFLILQREEMEKNGEITIEHKRKVKMVSSLIRRGMNETRMLSLALNSEGNKVGIFIYDKESTPINFIQTHYDAERNIPYIVEEEEELIHV